MFNIWLKANWHVNNNSSLMVRSYKVEIIDIFYCLTLAKEMYCVLSEPYIYMSNSYEVFVKMYFQSKSILSSVYLLQGLAKIHQFLKTNVISINS